jgi:hypothetical protein
MAGHEKDVYLILIAARDPQIRALLEQGFAFVTHTFKVGTVPPGLGRLCLDVRPACRRDVLEVRRQLLDDGLLSEPSRA